MRLWCLVGSALGPWGTIGGGLGGGLIGGLSTSAVQEETLNLLGFNDSHQRAVNAAENPWSAAGGQVAAAAAGGSPFGVARGAASALGAGASRAERVADFMIRNPRATLAGISTAAEAGMQSYQGEFHPEQLAGAAVGGGIFAKNYGWGIGPAIRGRYRYGMAQPAERHDPARPPGSEADAGVAASRQPKSRPEWVTRRATSVNTRTYLKAADPVRAVDMPAPRYRALVAGPDTIPCAELGRRAAGRHAARVCRR